FSLIFVALSTAALATIPRPKMTAATGLYNVVRQVFGSVGIAVAATQLTTHTAIYRAELVTHMGTTQLVQAQNFIQMTAAAMRQRGLDAIAATQRALAILDLRVTRQAATLAYNHVFLLVTLLFAISVPLVFLLKSSRLEGGAEIMVD